MYTLKVTLNNGDIPLIFWNYWGCGSNITVLKVKKRDYNNSNLQLVFNLLYLY